MQMACYVKICSLAQCKNMLQRIGMKETGMKEMRKPVVVAHWKEFAGTAGMLIA